ncbi:MAG: hypothetical protein HY002_09090 [Candidatus Rokubacteria bacterium]|nr:hypothetical protein [Candidatus Rokubacteria bacterium]
MGPVGLRAMACVGAAVLPSPPVVMVPVEDLVTERIARLDPRARRALFQAVEAAEAAVALFHRHRAGAPPVPHPIALTPFIVPRGLLPTLERLAECVHRLQARAPGLYRAGAPGFRALCPLAETTARWLEGDDGAPAPWALMIRPDVGLGAGRGRRRPRPILFETNATALAGLYNHAAGVAILKHEVFPRLLSAAERRRLADPPDLLALTVRWVLRAARRLGLAPPLGLAFLEDAAPVAGYSEIPRLMRAFEARGVRTAHGTAAELRLARGEVYLRDVRVDLAYRDLAYEDLGVPPTRGRRLLGLRTLLARNAVLPGFAGEFGHKGLLECLTRPEYARFFTAAERRLLAVSVPWTRVLSARSAEGPDGRRVDLPEYARRHRTVLLIKPNVGSSGEGILLGRETSAARWEARIARALREPGVWVVQARRPGSRRRMVYLRDGVAHTGPCYFSLGLFYAPGDLGLHCRVSRAPIVNVARGGALACAFPGG